MPVPRRSLPSTSRNPQSWSFTPTSSAGSRHPKRPAIPRRPRLSTREKVDDVLRYIRDEYDWSLAQFVAHFMTATSEKLHASPPEVRRKRFLKQVQDEGVDWIAMLLEADVRFEMSEHLVNVARREMDQLIAKSAYFGKWDASMQPDDINMVQATEDMIAHGPFFFSFLKQVCAHKRSHQDSSTERSDRAINFRILGMLSNMCNLYLCGGSNWLQKTIGVHFGNLGLKRRGIELFSVLGYCPSYKTINKDLDKIAEHSRARPLLATQPLDDVDFAEGPT